MSRSDYSKLSYTPSPSTTPIPSNILNVKPNSQEVLLYPRTDAHHKSWNLANTIWPLTMYCISALLIAGFLAFLNGRQFNINQRHPQITLPSGELVMSGHHALLQTDATTMLSILLSIFRWLLATWNGTLCWYTLFYLLDENGLSHRDVHYMITYGSIRPRSYFQSRITLLMSMILIFTTSAQFSAPLVTGSITWTPSNLTAMLPTNPSLEVAFAVNSDEWLYHFNLTSWRERVAVQAAAFATLAWGRDIEQGVFKRFLPSATGFRAGSTVANVTLPYFSITSFEWIKEPEKDLTSDQLDIPNQVAPILSTRNGSIPFITPGCVAFIPEGDWTLAQDFTMKPFPKASIVEESRVMVAYLSFQPQNPDCSDDSQMFRRPGPPPPVKYHRVANACYAFARVSYRAGAATCLDCRIMPGSIVQNHTELAVQPDPIAHEALRLLPDVMGNLVLANSSIPYSWNTFDEYVEAVLVRSYSGAWTGLSERLGRWADYGKLVTTVSPRIPTSRADVNLLRVSIWLAVHLLAISLGVCFFFVRSRSKSPLAGDTSMVPFYLDTTEVIKPTRPNDLPGNEELKVVLVDGNWKIVVKPKTN